MKFKIARNKASGLKANSELKLIIFLFKMHVRYPSDVFKIIHNKQAIYSSINLKVQVK